LKDDAKKLLRQILLVYDIMPLTLARLHSLH
jgi:hypothetical protein